MNTTDCYSQACSVLLCRPYATFCERRFVAINMHSAYETLYSGCCDYVYMMDRRINGWIDRLKTDRLIDIWRQTDNQTHHVAAAFKTHAQIYSYIYIYVYTCIQIYIHTYIYICTYSCIELRYITLRCITLRFVYVTLHDTTLHYTTLRYITLRYITVHYITLPYITLHYFT